MNSGLSAQRQAEQRSRRTIRTPIPSILDAIAKRHEVEQKNKTKTDATSDSYLDEATISGFGDLPEAMKASLMGKAAALHRTDRGAGIYSSDNVGLGLYGVKGADTLAESVNKRVGDAISEMNELAVAAGIDAEIESLKEI